MNKKTQSEKPDFEVKTVTPEQVTTMVEEKDDQSYEVISTSAIQEITKGEIDIQIATAHKFPRNVKKAVNDMVAMATMDEDTAESCFYTLPRAGKVIQGAGIRLAEIVGSSWGNIRYAGRLIKEDNEFVTCQGVAHDLEKNVSVSVEVRRRIQNSAGKRYNQDMIAMTINAGISIAIRNAIFKVVPKSLINNVYEQAKKVAIGDASTLIQRRQKAIDYFLKMGVPLENILATLEKATIEDVGLDELEILTGLKTAIKEGDTKVDIAFNLSQKPKVTGDKEALKTKDGLFPENENIK